MIYDSGKGNKKNWIVAADEFGAVVVEGITSMPVAGHRSSSPAFMRGPSSRPFASGPTMHARRAAAQSTTPENGRSPGATGERSRRGVVTQSRKRPAFAYLRLRFSRTRTAMRTGEPSKPNSSRRRRSRKRR